MRVNRVSTNDSGPRPSLEVGLIFSFRHAKLERKKWRGPEQLVGSRTRANHVPLTMAAPKGGDEPVAQGVSPGRVRGKEPPPPNGGGSTRRHAIQRSHVIRPRSGAILWSGAARPRACALGYADITPFGG